MIYGYYYYSFLFLLSYLSLSPFPFPFPLPSFSFFFYLFASFRISYPALLLSTDDLFSPWTFFSFALWCFSLPFLDPNSLTRCAMEGKSKRQKKDSILDRSLTQGYHAKTKKEEVPRLNHFLYFHFLLDSMEKKKKQERTKRRNPILISRKKKATKTRRKDLSISIPPSLSLFTSTQSVQDVLKLDALYLDLWT